MRFIADMWWLWLLGIIGSPVYGATVYRRANRRGNKQKAKPVLINFVIALVILLTCLALIILSFGLNLIDFIKS